MLNLTASLLNPTGSGPVCNGVEPSGSDALALSLLYSFLPKPLIRPPEWATGIVSKPTAGHRPGLTGTLPSSIQHLTNLSGFFDFQATFRWNRYNKTGQRGLSGTIPPMPLSLRDAIFAASGNFSGTLPEIVKPFTDGQVQIRNFIVICYSEFPDYFDGTKLDPSAIENADFGYNASAPLETLAKNTNLQFISGTFPEWANSGSLIELTLMAGILPSLTALPHS